MHCTSGSFSPVPCVSYGCLVAEVNALKNAGACGFSDVCAVGAALHTFRFGMRNPIEKAPERVFVKMVKKVDAVAQGL